MVDTWRIYFVRKCRHARPSPKSKLVVIVCQDGEKYHGFLINTRIVPYIKLRPALLVCQAPINVSQHSCLSHDSYVDCAELYGFTSGELNNPRNQISPDAKESIIKAVYSSKTIENRYKRLILG